MRPQVLGLGRLFESVRDAVIVAEANTGRIVLWNPAATKIFGYSQSEALNELRVEALVPKRLKGRHRAGMTHYRETGQGRYIDSSELLDLPAVRKTGEEIHIELSLSPVEPVRDLVGTDGRLVLAIVRNVTERKQAEQALRESQQRFQALVKNALDIVMVTEPDGTIRYISPSVERVLGYSPEEMLSTNTAEYVHPDDLKKGFDELAEALSKPGVHPVMVETRVRHKDGSWRYLEGIANNLLDDPVVGGVVFNHRDVTERKLAEEEVRRLNEDLEKRVKERTARLEAALNERERAEQALQEVKEAERQRMARDLHDGALQDLTYAQAEAQLVRMLCEDPQLNAGLEKALEALKRAGQGLRSAVYDLRLEETLQRSLISSLEALVKLNRQMAGEEYQVELLVEEGVEEAVPQAAGGQLVRIIQEALNNARRHSGARNVRVSLGLLEGGRLWAEVFDDGWGFEPWASRGGVGMSSMSQRAEALGGELEVKSEPGNGTRVRVRIPLPRAQKEEGQ